MCIGRETQMLGCGHSAWIVSRQCRSQASCSSVSWEEKTSLSGTCASCDASVHQKALSRAYEKRRETLLADWIEATSRGDVERAKEIEREAVRDVAVMKTRNAEISLTRDPSDVDFPQMEAPKS